MPEECRLQLDFVVYPFTLQTLCAISQERGGFLYYGSHGYSLLVDDGFGITRDQLIDCLKGQRIETRPFFYPLHLQPLYEHQFRGESYPVAEEFSQKGINLPSGNELTETQIRYIANAIMSLQRGVRYE